MIVQKISKGGYVIISEGSYAERNNIALLRANDEIDIDEAKESSSGL